MASSWFRFRLHDHTILAPLTAERAAALRKPVSQGGLGLELEPASAPADLAERLAPVVALVVGSRSSYLQRITQT